MLLAAALVFLGGCASPGAPRPPSLYLPATVRDLSAVRSGDNVELRFTKPTETTDGLPLRDPELNVLICRQDGPGLPCHPLPGADAGSPLRVPGASGAAGFVHWQEELPELLRSGAPRPLLYRVELRNAGGRSAGYSAPIVVAGGAAPPVVQSLHAEGMRRGVLLQWKAQAGAGEVLLRREQIDPVLPETAPATPAAGPKGRSGERAGLAAKAHLGVSQPRSRAPRPPEDGPVWLQADPLNPGAEHTVDGTVVPGVRYRYTAVRRMTVGTGNKGLELRSAPSSPVDVVWEDIYPPPAPEQLTAVGFGGGERPYAVDLVWQPVNDIRVTGYLVWRVTLSATGVADGGRAQLTPVPVPSPAFHDATAAATVNYRYEVSAVDGKGNTSPAARAVVQASLP